MATAADGTPTYELVLGAVGDSCALRAAERRGLPPSLVARAKELLPTEAQEGGDLAREMEALVGALERAEERAYHVELLEKMKTDFRA